MGFNGGLNGGLMTRIISNDIESEVGEPATTTVGLLLVVNGLAKRELPVGQIQLPHLAIQIWCNNATYTLHTYIYIHIYITFV